MIPISLTLKHIGIKGKYLRKAAHLSSFGEPSRLLIHTRRFRCLDCRQTFVPALPGVRPGRHSTEPFREDVYRRHHDGVCASALARAFHLGAATVERIYHQFTARKARERLSLQCPVVLGIDEHTLHKGTRFATTFADLKNHRGSLAVLRMRPSRLSAAQKLRLGELFKIYPSFEPLYDHMQALCCLLNRKHQTKRHCRPLTRQLLGFVEALAASRFEPLVTLANTLRSWAEPIACMWRFTKNNGITEGFHRKMKLIQRRAYGFRNFENYRLRVIAQCG